MDLRRHRIGTAVVTIAIGLSVVAPAVAIDRPTTIGHAHAANRIFVRFEPGATGSERAAIRSAAMARTARPIDLVPGLEVIETRIPVAEALHRLRGHGGVAYAEPDYEVRADALPNDPGLIDQWGLRNVGQEGGTPGADIDAEGAWAIRTSASTVTVAVIDTGIDLDHPDLTTNLWVNTGEIAGNGIDDDANGYVDDRRGIDAVNADSVPDDDNGHGTHVAGTIGARGNNGIGVTGVAWQARLMAIKAFGADGEGFVSWVVEGLRYARTNGARIVNASYGATSFSRAEYDAVNAAGAAGILIVAAAGNAGVDTDVAPHYPAAYPLGNIISVAATTRSDGLAGFSNRGLRSVDLGAPGLDIINALPGGYGWLSGTSMATPHVSGAAALLLARSPGLDPAGLRSRLLGTVRPVAALSGLVLTGGVLDIGSALSADPATVVPTVPLGTHAPSPSTVSPAAPPPVQAPTPPTIPSSLAAAGGSEPIDPSIVIDDSGNAMIAFERWNQGTFLATEDGATWSTRRLVSAHDQHFPDLALGSDGVPVVALMRHWRDALAYWDPGIVIVRAGTPATAKRLTAACPDASTCYEDREPDVEVAADGSRHVVFARTEAPQTGVVAPGSSSSDVPGPGLYYATDASGVWVVSRLVAGAVFAARIAVAPDGTIHTVAYRSDGASTGLWHYVQSGGAWTGRQLTASAEDRSFALASDGAGGLAVVFARASLGLYLIRRSAGGTWGPTQRISSVAASGPDLAVAADGTLHVAAVSIQPPVDDQLAGPIAYLTDASGSWARTVFGPAGAQELQPSIAVATDGAVHIAFHRGRPLHAGLYHRTNRSGTWVERLVAIIDRPLRAVGGIDAAGTTHIVVPRFDGRVGLEYRTDASGAWSGRSLVTAPVAEAAAAVTPEGDVHVAYSLTLDPVTGTWLPLADRRLRYGTNASGTWTHSTIASGFFVLADILVDAAGIPRVIFIDPDGALRSALRSGASWTVSQIAGGEWDRVDAAIGPGGAVHIIGRRFDGSGWPLVHVTNATGSWVSKVVSAAANGDSDPVIAVGGSGVVYVAAWRPGSGIRLFTRTGSTWTSAQRTTHVDDIQPTIAVDAVGIVRLAWTRWTPPGACPQPACLTGRGVLLQSLDGGTWTTTRVVGPSWDHTPTVLAGPGGAVVLLTIRTGVGVRWVGLIGQ